MPEGKIDSRVGMRSLEALLAVDWDGEVCCWAWALGAVVVAGADVDVLWD